MDHGVVGICLIVLYVVFLSLPEGIYSLIKVPPALRYSLAGVVGAAALALVVFDVWRRTFEIPYREQTILIGMCLLSPLWFSIGARRSLREVGRHRAKALRWANAVGFAVSVGLIICLLASFARHGHHAWLVHTASVAVVVLALSRVVLWQPPTKFRWTRFLPGYPAILLMPAVLVVWAVLCTYLRYDFESETHWIGWGFPLLFYEGRWGPAADYSGYRFRLTAYLVDLLLAVVVAWVLAWGADRVMQRWVRPRRGGTRSPAGG